MDGKILPLEGPKYITGSHCYWTQIKCHKRVNRVSSTSRQTLTKKIAWGENVRNKKTGQIKSAVQRQSKDEDCSLNAVMIGVNHYQCMH